MPDFSIVSSRGAVPLVTQSGDGEFVLERDSSGLGLPSESLRFAESAAGGGRYQGGRYAMRDAVLVIGVEGDTEDALEASLRLLASHVDRSASPTLVAQYAGGEKWSMGFYRTGGGEDVRSILPTYERWEFDIRCPRPLWVREAPVTVPEVNPAAEKLGLLPYLSALPVTGSTAYGDLVVENPGDVETPVNWRITGPGGPCEIVLGGRGFTVDAVLTEGEVISIVRTPTGWTVTDQTGANRYSDLGPAPKFPSAPVGVSTGYAAIVDAGAGSSVAGWFNPQRKMVR
ncbi:MAG: hypothetical protein DBW62_00605 [Microbacterium sp.]|nr:MAG: hypothetical protein DBW62_00605 [Microbacterium sp.]